MKTLVIHILLAELILSSSESLIQGTSTMVEQGRLLGILEQGADDLVVLCGVPIQGLIRFR